jgi:hypothetical protein
MTPEWTTHLIAKVSRRRPRCLRRVPFISASGDIVFALQQTNAMNGQAKLDDPDKAFTGLVPGWKPAFGKSHTQTKNQTLIRFNLIESKSRRRSLL